jgi:hypothetical protein
VEVITIVPGTTAAAMAAATITMTIATMAGGPEGTAINSRLAMVALSNEAPGVFVPSFACLRRRGDHGGADSA